MSSFLRFFLCLSMAFISPLTAVQAADDDYDRNAPQEVPDAAKGMTQVAKKAEKSQRKAAVANMAIGTAMMIAGMAMAKSGMITGSTMLTVAGTIMMGMGMQAQNTSGSMSTSADASGFASTFSSTDLTLEEKEQIKAFTGETLGNDGTGDRDRDQALMQAQGIDGTKQAMAELEQLGFKFDQEEGAITMPDGKKLDEDDFTEEGMMANGLSSQMAANVMGKIGKLEEEAMKKFKIEDKKIAAIDVVDDGFVGSGGGDTLPSGFSYTQTSDEEPAARKPKISGLTKKLGDSRIGVASDSLFDLVKKRYNDLGRAGFFIPEEIKKKRN